MNEIKFDKPILAMETSSEICGVSVFFNNEKFTETNLKIKNIHSEKILEITGTLLNTSGVKLNECSAIAVSSGPGSFTGLRIGMSTAKGLAIGSNLPIIPVPTFEALAFHINQYLPASTEFIIANKVNVEEIYYAKFKSKNPVPEVIEETQVLMKEELNSKINDKVLIFGNAVKPENQIGILVSPSASAVAKWAYNFGKDLLNYNFDFMEPFYLKNFVTKQG